MAQIYTRYDNSLENITLNQTLPRISKTELAEAAYSMFIFASAVLLIGLGLRTFLALFLVTGPFARGLTIFTDPFVMPFDRIFKDAHTMVQASTAAAFTAYYFVRATVALSHGFILHISHNTTKTTQTVLNTTV